MAMRRDMRVAAAASILLLAAGTGAANANPLSAIGSAIAAVTAVNNVEVEIHSAVISDRTEQTLSIKWYVNNEDASIADRQSGYCARAKVADSSWQEECFDEAPASTQTYPRRATRYYMSMNIEEEVSSGSHKVTVQVKMRYGTGGGLYTSWSPEYWSSEMFGNYMQY